MNTKSISLVLFFILTFFSCSQKKEIELEDYKGLILSMVNMAELSIELNNDAVRNVNGLNLKLAFMRQDPRATKTAHEVTPISEKVKVLANKTDDVFLSTLNLLIEKEENIENWFEKNQKSQFTTYRSFYGMQNVDSPKWATELLGVSTKESISNAEELRLSLLKYRDQLILTVADSVKNDKNQLKLITIENLNNYESFKTYLEETEHPNKYELSTIFYELTVPETIEFANDVILWNRKAFHNQPMIGVINTLTYYRIRIRKAQEMATKILLSRVDKPLLPLFEYQK